MQEAAREAADRQARGGRGRGYQQNSGTSEMDLEASGSSMMGIDPEQIALLRAMQAAEMGDQASFMSDMMGLGTGHNESVQSLLEMLSQQEQENQRPHEHYLTIAQNGKVDDETQ